MFLSKKEIEDECHNLYDELTANQYNSDNVLKKLNERTGQLRGRIFQLILDIDYEIATKLSNDKRRSIFWGLLPYERDAIWNICDIATEENKVDVFYKAFDEYFRFFLDDNLKYAEICDQLVEEIIPDELSRLREHLLSYYFKKENFIAIEKKIRQSRTDSQPAPSVCTIIWTIVKDIDKQVKGLYYDRYLRKSLYYFTPTQDEFDELFVICEKGNRCGITLYYNNDSKNGLNDLSTAEIDAIYDVTNEAVSKYFKTLADDNKNYKKIENEFVSKMNEFGKRHDMSERELVNFADGALKMGYNVADIETQEELDEVYKKVYPEA